MLTGMALAACCYMPIYHGMAAQADWKSWSPEDQEIKIEENASKELHIEIKTWKYSNGAIRTERIETSTAVKDIGKESKITNTVKLSEINIFMIGLLIFIQLVFVCMAYGPIAAFLVELFPPEIRYTSLSLPYHIGNGVFGGLTPLIAESLVVSTGNIFSGLWYPIIIAGTTVVLGAFLIKERKRPTQDISS